MTEEPVAAARDARLMPSWSPSEPQDEQREPRPSAAAPTSASEIEAARRLLEELFEDTDAPADDSAPDSRQ